MKKSSPGVSLFLTVVILAVVAVAGLGLYTSGSPSQERARRFDDQRVNQLQQISNAIDGYWNVNKALPSTLAMLQASPNMYYIESIVDLETRAPYEYLGSGTTTYQLCASFNTDNTVDQPGIQPQPYLVFWRHPMGRTCFDLKVNVQPGTVVPMGKMVPPAEPVQ